MIARILTVFIVLVLLARLHLRYRRGEISLRRMLFWTVPWIGVGLVMLSPEWADTLALFLGIETATGVDFLTYVAVGVAFYLLFRLFIRLDHIERHLTTLARHSALRDGSED